MTKELKGKQIAKNISLSLFAQVISLLVSFVLGLVVPRYIDEYQYAYWHTFLLYVNYVGIFHFGLLDGLVLRYSQYDYDELDKRKIRSEFVALLCINTVACFALIVYGIKSGGFSQTIAILVSFGVLTKNIFTYNSYLFQVTNRISKYAFVVIAQRLAYGVTVIFLIAFHQQNFVWFCIADLLGDCVGIGLSLFSNRELHFGKILPLKDIMEETWLNVSSGILLMIANWSSMLIIGSAKMIVELKWGALLFGKTSFAFSLANLILIFVTAISIVLFPSLKRMKQEALIPFYKNLRDMLVPLLFWSLILYYPECWFLEKWLPKYKSSLIYLGILSPLIVYTSIVSLLTNNYLKAYRKEKVLLIINILSVIFAIVLYGISAYWFVSFSLTLLSVVLVVMLRSMISEIAVSKLIKLDLKREFVIEFVMTCAFLVSAHCFNYVGGFIFYSVFLIIYSYVEFKRIRIFCNLRTPSDGYEK